MKKIILYISLLLVGGTMILSGCKKDKKTETNDGETQTAQDNSLAEGIFNDVNNIANQALQNDSLTNYRDSSVPDNVLSSPCAAVARHDTAGHGTVEISFGTYACFCRDNRYRKGNILFHYSGAYRDSGTVINISFDNYYVGRDSANMYKVTGTKTVENLGLNASGHIRFAVHVTGYLQNSSGQTMTWISSREREWIAGESTVGIWWDDQYMISGSASGTSFNGTSFTLLITVPLHVDLSCRWIKDGKFDFTPGTSATRRVNYGAGSCDAIATVTINGITYTIALP